MELTNKPKKRNEINNLGTSATIKDVQGENIVQYNAEKIQIINNINGSYGIDKRFFVGFCNAFIEIASNPNLGKIEMNLICLILGLMGKDEEMLSPNKQVLRDGSWYAKQLNTYQPHISKAFKVLEDNGYIKRCSRLINILINPEFATNTSTKKYKDLIKDPQYALPFGLEIKEPLTEQEQEKLTKQDWESSVNLND